jgi:hypothetical protein
MVWPVFATGAGHAHTIDADNKNIPVNTTSAVNNLFFIILSSKKYMFSNN